MATNFEKKLTLTYFVQEISARFLRHYRRFGDGPLNADNRIFPRTTFVAVTVDFHRLLLCSL